jgi:hypothetical protein
MKKYHSEYYTEGNWNANPFVNTHMNHKIFTENLTGKDKNRFLIWYYKTVKKMITKEVIQDIKKEIQNKWDGNEFTNDEILLHDYEVIAWWFYKEKDYDRFYFEEIPDTKKLDELDAQYDEPMELIINHYWDEFIQWKSDLNKKYPGLCTNYVTKNDVIKINISVNKFPKCKK